MLIYCIVQVNAFEKYRLQYISIWSWSQYVTRLSFLMQGVTHEHMAILPSQYQYNGVLPSCMIEGVRWSVRGPPFVFKMVDIIIANEEARRQCIDNNAVYLFLLAYSRLSNWWFNFVSILDLVGHQATKAGQIRSIHNSSGTSSILNA